MISESDIIERTDELHGVERAWDENERCRNRHIQDGYYRKKRQRGREPIDDAILWPNRRAGHNSKHHPIRFVCFHYVSKIERSNIVTDD